MADEAKNTLEPIVKLQKRARDVARSLGLEMAQFVVMTDEEHEGHHHVSAMFTKAADPPALPERDEEFDQMMDEQRVAEQEARAEQARKELLEDLSDTIKHQDKGIGLDD